MCVEILLKMQQQKKKNYFKHKKQLNQQINNINNKYDIGKSNKKNI